MAFILLVLFLGMDYGSSFSIVWAALGPVVGVITGAIPSYFFKQEADKATRLANRQAKIAAVYAEQLSPDAAHVVESQLQARDLLHD
jgi:hypothetical protein